MTKKIEFKTEKRKISELKGCDYNPRTLTKKQYSDLKKSIIKFNYAEIALINTDNTIVAGHQRLKILEELKGADHVVDVRVPNREFTKEEFDEYLIRSNKNTGEWDWDMLANNFEMDNLKEWGFEDSEFGFDEGAEETEGDDDVPEQPKESITLKGDLYELGEHRLLCGDSTVITDVDKLMDGNKADMVFTDPPYNADYKSRGKDELLRKGIKNDNMSNDEFQQFAEKIFTILRDNIYKGSSLYVCCNWKDSYPRFYSIAEQNNINISNCIVWNKQSAGMGWNDYRYQFEFIIYGFEKTKKHNFYGDRKNTDLWSLKRDARQAYSHPTQKPIELIEKAILNSSLQGHRVLDLFTGSGSTLIACEKTNRKCYGMELDEKYCDVIVKRYIDFCMTNNRPFNVKRNGKDIGGFK